MMSSLICSIFILLGFCLWFAPKVAKVFVGVFCRKGFWLSSQSSDRFLAGFCRKGFWRFFGGYMPKITKNLLELVQFNFKALFRRFTGFYCVLCG